MTQPWPVVDLFSGAGGMSCGFSRRPGFVLAGAALMAAQSEPAPVREHGYWTRTIQGQINASGMERLRVVDASVFPTVKSLT